MFISGGRGEGCWRANFQSGGAAAAADEITGCAAAAERVAKSNRKEKVISVRLSAQLRVERAPHGAL